MDFYYKTHCDRCLNSLDGIMIMSWFTEETICMDCKAEEAKLKSKLEKAGIDTRSLEGCGYIPSLPKSKSRKKKAKKV